MASSPRSPSPNSCPTPKRVGYKVYLKKIVRQVEYKSVSASLQIPNGFRLSQMFVARNSSRESRRICWEENLGDSLVTVHFELNVLQAFFFYNLGTLLSQFLPVAFAFELIQGLRFNMALRDIANYLYNPIYFSINIALQVILF